MVATAWRIIPRPGLVSIVISFLSSHHGTIAGGIIPSERVASGVIGEDLFVLEETAAHLLFVL
jgi:hypothetical protein